MTGPSTVECIERLQTAADALLAKGASPINIIAALGEVAVNVVAQTCELAPERQLEILATVLLANAETIRAKSVQQKAE